jgi:hypothetical protein
MTDSSVPRRGGKWCWQARENSHDDRRGPTLALQHFDWPRFVAAKEGSVKAIVYREYGCPTWLGSIRAAPPVQVPGWPGRE